MQAYLQLQYVTQGLVMQLYGAGIGADKENVPNHRPELYYSFG